jgi:Na+-translocating ferredoxin:NAD+ oxidoreductase subunit C
MLEYTPDRRLTGGLRLPANKSDSTAQPIKRGFNPSRLILSLGQRHGPAAQPVVAVGERVLRGQTVAKATSSFAADVHASISGVVQSIEERLVPSPAAVDTALCIVIAADGKNEAIDFADNLPWPEEREAQLARLREGGIVGLGGAAYPTAAKLGAAQACRTLIINGAECEPYISCDDLLMREAAEEVVAGTKIMGALLGVEQCIIAIERDKPLAIDAIGRAAEGGGSPSLRLAELPSIYPAGGERQLVEVLTGREVPAGRYPSDIGLTCQNVGTAVAVYRLAAHGEPLMTRIVTVTGGGVREHANVEVPIGAPIAELIEFCGGYHEDVRRLVHGGSMMGYALPTDDIPVTKGTNCIIAATLDEVRADYSEWSCIRCGECASVCPARLQPQELLVAARAPDFAALETLGLMECIECGCCDVVCPSHIPLTEIFRRAKTAYRSHERNIELSAESEQRHMRREERQRAEAEQAKQAQEQLRSGIDAAIERARRGRERGGDTD